MNVSWGVAERSGRGFGLQSWFLVCLKGQQDGPDEGFGVLYILLCFVLISWSHLGAQLCVLMVVAYHMVPKTTESKTGTSLEAASGRAAGRQGLGDWAVGSHRQMFHPLLELMVLIHHEGRPTGKSSEAAFAHTWLQLAVPGIGGFFFFFLIKQE